MKGDYGAARGGVLERHAHEVADRDDPDDLPIVHDREVPEAAVDHERGGLAGGLGSIDGLRVLRHPLAHARVLGESRRNRLEDISLGEDPLELVAVHDEHGAHAAPDHAPHGLGHPLLRIDDQQVARHVIPDHGHAPILKATAPVRRLGGLGGTPLVAAPSIPPKTTWEPLRACSRRRNASGRTCARGRRTRACPGSCARRRRRCDRGASAGGPRPSGGARRA